MKKYKNYKNKDIDLTPTRRGASFVLGLGTKVFKDKKKESNKNACRK